MDPLDYAIAAAEASSLKSHLRTKNNISEINQEYFINTFFKRTLIISFFRLPWITSDYFRLPWTDYPGLHQTTSDYPYVLPRTTPDYFRLP